MKYYSFILLFSLACCEQRISNKSENNITDKEIAISVAEKKWNEVYGKSAINEQKPFVAERKNDSIWTVHGSFPKPPVIGGVAYAEVNVKTKEVIKYTHGE
ncbi:NTF2 fold immunity protein [Chryseobacterium sp. JV274]|uniref:NTF2 fold immunity protein n=1 Tax=unclassified Chryseobacterium TaxID=2593645 RepID=UPI0015C24C3B|nr:NTF2 fold immunity protein [Chryseobacterium sp. JV274]CAD0225809.1 Imm-NTF2-2 domain-containing protein [Chryseobacterium sp. JV274]